MIALVFVLAGGLQSSTTPAAAPSPTQTSFTNQGNPSCVRWIHDDGGDRWVPQNVVLGDDGASILAAKEINAHALCQFSGGSSSAVFEFSVPDTADYWVAMGEGSSLSAALVSADIDPGFDFRSEGTLYVFDSASDGAPLWTHTMPGVNEDRLGGGVAVSRDGSRIVGVWPDFGARRMRVDVLASDGTLIASHAIRDDFPTVRDVEISDDGKRIYMRMVPDVVVFNVETGVVELRTGHGSIFSSESLSGDGSRLSLGSWNGSQARLEVYERDANDTWTRIFHELLDDRALVAATAFNTLGDRLAYVVQDADFEWFDVRLYDFTQGADLFSKRYEAPGTSLQLFGADLDIDDRGEVVGGASWGDDQHRTPEGFILDESGQVLCEVTTRGSGLRVDLDATGEMMVLGAKATHASVLGSGGDILILDALPSPLRVLGRPNVGQSVDLSFQAQPPGSALFLFVGTDLIDAPDLRIDPASLLLILGPFPIDVDLNLPLDIPNDPLLAGFAVHFQGVVLAAGSENSFSNKVSVRFVP